MNLSTYTFYPPKKKHENSLIFANAFGYANGLKLMVAALRLYQDGCLIQIVFIDE